MYRIDTPTNATSLPAPAAIGTPGYFTDGNPSSTPPVAATNLDQDFWNMIQEELMSIASLVPGFAAAKNVYNQVLAGVKWLIQSQSGNYAVDTGAANAYVVAFSPALTARSVGTPFRAKFINANTGASTIADGVGGTPALVALDGTALRANDIAANSMHTFAWDGTSYRVRDVLGQRISAGISDTATSNTLTISNNVNGAGSAGILAPLVTTNTANSGFVLNASVTLNGLSNNGCHILVVTSGSAAFVGTSGVYVISVIGNSSGAIINRLTGSNDDCTVTVNSGEQVVVTGPSGQTRDIVAGLLRIG